MCNKRESKNLLLSRICNEEALSNEENVKLIELARQGDKKAEEDLIIGNGKLVYHIYNTKFNNKVLEDDLIQEGLIALSSAIYSYDVTKGIKFSTYAYTLIYNQMYEFWVLNNTSGISYSSSMGVNLNKIKKAKKRLTDRGEPVTDYNVMNEAKMSSSTYYNTVNHKLDVMSLDKKIGNDSDSEMTVSDIISCDNDFENEIVQKAAYESLTGLLQEYMSDRNFDIICKKYGLNRYKESTLEELGKEYSMTASGIQALISTQFKRLKNIKSLQVLR